MINQWMVFWKGWKILGYSEDVSRETMSDYACKQSVLRNDSLVVTVMGCRTEF